jgi:Kef-type K+ transport system membrane component KefB
LYLYPRLSHSGVPFTSFALFMGVAMSITAFPVLARILTDRGIQKTQLGVVALGCAATDDVTAWCLLAFVVGVAQAKIGGAFAVLGLTLAYIAVMFLVVRPAATRFFARYTAEDDLTPNLVALVFAALLISALITEYIGIHAVFGAFLLGAIIPHDSPVARALTGKLEDLVTILLLPAFFAFTGMRTEIGLVSGYEQWLVCGLIILVATAGKFGGTLVAGRLTGLAWRDATALGLLMNTRGLMELIVLNIGLDLNVISPTLFAMMVVMALVTTMAASPLLALVSPVPRFNPASGELNVS